MKATLNSKIVELKTLLHRASHMQTTPRNVGTPWEDSTSREGQMQFIRIVPRSVILPSRNLVEQSGFIKVNLAVIPTYTLKIVQTQVQEELRGQELNTYKQNKKLSKDNEELHRSANEVKDKLVMEQYNANMMEKTIDDLCIEFLHYNISSDVALP